MKRKTTTIAAGEFADLVHLGLAFQDGTDSGVTFVSGRRRVRVGRRRRPTAR